MRERRRHFLINKSLQLRYMLTVALTLAVVTTASLVGLYFGIWGGVLDSFSDQRILNDLVTAARMQQYEEARRPQSQAEDSFFPLSIFRQAELLSERQQEIFKEILDETNRNLSEKLFFLLLLIAAGTIFLSHKIAGPFYRFEKVLSQIKKGEIDVRCHLRKFDEAKSVAQALNGAVESLDLKVSRLKKIVQEEKNSDRLLDRLKEALSQFKTTSDL